MKTADQLNQYRQRRHPVFGTGDDAGMNGVFVIPMSKTIHNVERWAVCFCSDGSDPEHPVDWEHVSLRIEERKGKSVVTHTPTWEEMCVIKDLFWSEDEVVMQLHPARKDYVNIHPHVLHLWKPKNASIPLPPQICV